MFSILDFSSLKLTSANHKVLFSISTIRMMDHVAFSNREYGFVSSTSFFQWIFHSRFLNFKLIYVYSSASNWVVIFHVHN